MAQLEEVWIVNRVVGRSSIICVKLTKCLQQAFNFKIAGSFGLRPRLGGLVYHNNIVCMLKIHLCPSHIGHVLRLPGAVRWMCFALCIPPDTLTAPEVIGYENRVIFNLPFLLDPSSIIKMQSSHY